MGLKLNNQRAEGAGVLTLSKIWQFIFPNLNLLQLLLDITPQLSLDLSGSLRPEAYMAL